VNVAPQPQQTAITSTQVKPAPQDFAKTPPPQAETAPKAPAAPVTIPAVINFDVAGCKPEWPRASLRNEETGTVSLSVLVGADGSISEVRIDKSSGFRNLDNAVKSQLMSGSCKQKPGTVDGKPQQTWSKVNYVWKLE
jgi:protein TonB